MVCVVGNTGKKLMPTNERRARRLLGAGRARIYKRRPFTIQLLDRENGATQPMEYKCDTGYQNIGISICSEKHESVSTQYDLIKENLNGEVERHKAKSRYRRTRRNRKRYRKPRLDNRKGMIAKEGFAPSIRNKRDRHIDLYKNYVEVMPITSVVFEMGQFDTQVLKAAEKGKPLPQCTDYQHGEQYGYATLREAVFARDNYTCIICKKSPFKDKNVILRMHHRGYWKGDRTNRMANLSCVCTKCHSPKNHKPGGKLYGLDPVSKSFKGASFMTSVRFNMFEKLKSIDETITCHMTYGAMTKLKRGQLGIKKSHVNDAYAMGDFHPKYRAHTEHYQKRRRNNRVLEKFYDAKYIDMRDGSKKSGSDLGCNRTNRTVPRMNDKNLRIYHGAKVFKGRRAIRKMRYPIQPGDKALIGREWYMTSGMHNNGTRLMVNKKSYSIKDVKKVVYAGGWIKLSETALLPA